MQLKLTPWSGEPASMKYDRVTFKVLPYSIAEADWMARLNELKATVDWSSMSKEEQKSYSGQAMAGTICTGFDEFTIPNPDGVGVTVTFDGESTDPRFRTQGEQLLAQDQLLRTELFNFSFERDNFRDMQERKTTGES